MVLPFTEESIPYPPEEVNTLSSKIISLSKQLKSGLLELADVAVHFFVVATV